MHINLALLDVQGAGNFGLEQVLELAAQRGQSAYQAYRDERQDQTVFNERLAIFTHYQLFKIVHGVLSSSTRRPFLWAA
jgi:hypothetical protein